MPVSLASSFAALLFDLDGTLIDSMPLHARAWGLWHRAAGIPFDDAHFFAHSAGRTNEEILSALRPDSTRAEREAIAEHKEALYRELLAQELTAIPGAFDLLHAARAHGRKLAICTAAPAKNLAAVFARFALRDLVDTVTSPADGLRGKPHPDLFAEAARRLAAAPRECLVFEDAPLGIEAARRAGMRAIAITTSLPVSAFAAFDNVIACVADLRECVFAAPA